MSGAIRRKPEPRRACVHCGMQLRRKRMPGGRLEDYGVFTRRKYCDQQCMSEGMVQPDVTRGAHMWRARKHKKLECEECGATTRLQAHHVDENWRNNAPSNIATLCATCHLKLHWSKRQHRGHLRTVDGDHLDGLIGLCEQAYGQLPEDLAAQMREHITGLWSRPGSRAAAQLVRMIDE